MNRSGGFRGNNKVLAKRQLMKSANAMGISAIGAHALTAKDVQGADSDQVAISMDGDDWVEYVPKGWFNRVKRARRAKDRLADRLLERDGVIEVNYSSGHHGGDNPHVTVVLYENSESKDKRRGEVPERENDTPVRVKEAPNRPRSASSGCDLCDADCDDKEAPDTSKIPGGLRVTFDGHGTLTSQLVNGSDHNLAWGWATNAHVVAAGDDQGRCGSDLIGKWGRHYNNSLGTVQYISHRHDFAVIEPYSDYRQPAKYVTDTSNPGTEILIEGTLTDWAIDEYMANEGDSRYTVQKYGIGSCYSWGYIKSRGRTVRDKFDRDPCRYSYDDQVGWGAACDDGFSEPDIDCGDSGSLTFASHPDGGTWYAVCLNRGATGLNRVSGTSGHALREQHNFWWQDF